MFTKILVGFDGSAHGRRAVDAAIELAGRFAASLTVALVRPTGSDEAPADLEKLLPFGDDGRSLGVVLDQIRDRGVLAGAREVDWTVLRGEVVDRLVEMITRRHYDLVVVGSRGLSAGRRLLLGSVSSALVDRAPCPVLVVRPMKRSSSGGTAAAAKPRA
jgi:nucleotide-binding universal stress UspA family protein